MDAFPAISRKICEIVNKKDADWETKFKITGELDQVLDHIDFNKMHLEESSGNIKAVLNSIEQGFVKEST
jgi:hypothetical protein